ncbi:ATP-binding protein [Streptomyces sp. NPDC057798]|uniref:ATP-binding protein n=1 Tax=Streptomyces sp. NPDC057798 TaxID=3346252 RepID=UPI00369A9E03
MSGYEVTEFRPRCVLPFEAAPAEVPLLRRAALEQLSRWGMPVTADEAGLLVTELVTNVVKHVGEGTAATLILEWREERLRVEVHDKSLAVPSLNTLGGCEEECGRGLHLLAALTLDWGITLTTAGKAVWCELSTSEQRTCRRIERAVHLLEGYVGADGLPPRGGRGRPAALEESAVELIADWLHWTAARGHDPDDFLDRALVHFEAEAGVA